jgi:hypothetical protein
MLRLQIDVEQGEVEIQKKKHTDSKIVDPDPYINRSIMVGR